MGRRHHDRAGHGRRQHDYRGREGREGPWQGGGGRHDRRGGQGPTGEGTEGPGCASWVELHGGPDEQVEPGYSIEKLLEVGQEAGIPFSVAGGIKHNGSKVSNPQARRLRLRARPSMVRRIRRPPPRACAKKSNTWDRFSTEGGDGAWIALSPLSRLCGLRGSLFGSSTPITQETAKAHARARRHATT